MPARKRGHDEMTTQEEPQRDENPLLNRIRSMSEFAALYQFIFMFGKVIKVPEIDIEDLEQECILPMHSQMLSEIGLSILKFVSSFRGLTFDNFEEYTRRQYLVKAPDLNPFGDEEEPKKFAEFNVFTKIRILHQLSVWTFWNPDRMREKMPDATMDEQISWRVDPCGWDSDERIYYILDDDRLYRQTDPPIPEPVKKKTRTTPRSRASRASKRRTARIIPDTTEDEADDNNNGIQDTEKIDYEPNFEGKKWECVAVSMEEYVKFLDSIKKSRDPDEKNLHRYITSEILPILEEKEEARQRKERLRLKELENMEKLLSAKRSSRIAQKVEKQKEVEAAEEAERKRLADLEMAHKEQERQRKIEEARQSRMMTREQRIREREVKRILHEEQIKQEQEQLAKLSEDDVASDGRSRISERHLKADLERRKRELESLEQEEDEWVFDCAVCGIHGRNLDDGTHSIACEECNVWQHSACHGIAKEQAESDDFHFVCKDCHRKKENPIPPLKVKFGALENTKPKEPPSIESKPEPPQPAQAIPAVSTAPTIPTVLKPAPVAPPSIPIAARPDIPHHPVAPVLPVLPPIRAYPSLPGALKESPPRLHAAPSFMPFVAQREYPLKPSPAPSFVPSPPQSKVSEMQQAMPTLPSILRPSNPALPVQHSNGPMQSSPQALARILPGVQNPAPVSGVFPSRQLPPLESPPRPFNAVPAQPSAPLNAGIFTPNASFSANGHHGLPSIQNTPGPHGPPISHSPLPTPHLPSPKQIQTPLVGQRSFSGSQNGLEGSSPGYSPMKHSSPPRPMSSNGVDKSIMSQPVTLEPRPMAPVTSPPVKRASPMLPPLHQIMPPSQSPPNSQSSNFGNGSPS